MPAPDLPPVGGFVRWGGGPDRRWLLGRVDLIVKHGRVPGAPGTAADGRPVLRVVEWQATPGGGYSPTRRRVAVPAGDAQPVPPPRVFAGDTHAQLVALAAAHADAAPAVAVKTAYERGLLAWPGPGCGLARQEWGLARAVTFLRKVAGGGVAGYRRDDDLLRPPRRTGLLSRRARARLDIKAWREDLHPRGRGGRFARHGTGGQPAARVTTGSRPHAAGEVAAGRTAAAAEFGAVDGVFRGGLPGFTESYALSGGGMGGDENEQAAQHVKGEVAKDLARRMNTMLPAGEHIDEAAVSHLVRLWAISSNDNNAEGLALQETARDVFELGGAAGWDIDPATARAAAAARAENSRTYEAFLRAQYAATQERFAAAGVTHVHLYRGFKWPSSGRVPDWALNPADDVDIQLRPMSSFSISSMVAEEFTGLESADFGYDDEDAESEGAVIDGTVPVGRIIAMPRTGVGCLVEGEVVVLAGPGRWRSRWTVDESERRQEELTDIVRTARDAGDRRHAVRQARRHHLEGLVPAGWLAEFPAEGKAAGAGPPPAVVATVNEDWLRVRTWDVRADDGALIDTLDGLARALRMGRAAAARWLLTLPAARAAPAKLLVEARAATGGGPAA